MSGWGSKFADFEQPCEDYAKTVSIVAEKLAPGSYLDVHLTTCTMDELTNALTKLLTDPDSYLFSPIEQEDIENSVIDTYLRIRKINRE